MQHERLRVGASQQAASIQHAQHAVIQEFAPLRVGMVAQWCRLLAAKPAAAPQSPLKCCLNTAHLVSAPANWDACGDGASAVLPLHMQNAVIACAQICRWGTVILEVFRRAASCKPTVASAVLPECRALSVSPLHAAVLLMQCSSKSPCQRGLELKRIPLVAWAGRAARGASAGCTRHRRSSSRCPPAVSASDLSPVPMATEAHGRLLACIWKRLVVCQPEVPAGHSTQVHLPEAIWPRD